MVLKEWINMREYKYKDVMKRYGIKDTRIPGSNIFYKHGRNASVKAYISNQHIDMFQTFTIYIKFINFKSFTKWLMTLIEREVERLEESDDPNWNLAKDVYLDIKEVQYEKQREQEKLIQ